MHWPYFDSLGLIQKHLLVSTGQPMKLDDALQLSTAASTSGMVRLLNAAMGT